MRKQIAAVTLVTAFAHGAGLLKLWLIANVFGVGAELDGYNLALVIPTFVSGVLSGALQASLFPVRARFAASAEATDVERFERLVILGLFAFGLIAAVCLLPLRSALLSVFAASAAEEVREATSYVLPYALMLIPLNAIGDGLGYMLAFRNRYQWAAAAPIANALFSAALLFAWPEGRLLNLALGTVLGVALQIAVTTWALSQAGFRPFARAGSFAAHSQSWRSMMRLSGWVLPGVLLSNLTSALPTVLIAAYGVGAVSAFGYAWRLHTVAVQLLVMASGPVLLAEFANLVARGEHERVRGVLRHAVGLSAAVGVAAVAGVVFLGELFLTVLFSGRFDHDAAQAVTLQWRWLAIALGPALLGNVFAKLWQASGRAQLLTVLSASAFAVFLLSVYLLRPSLGAQAVSAAVAVSAASVVTFGWRSAWVGTGRQAKEVS
jgi:peptidoglycan biosynthesis protein MviN/MurJ (putative lipid II flippase)